MVELRIFVCRRPSSKLRVFVASNFYTLACQVRHQLPEHHRWHSLRIVRCILPTICLPLKRVRCSTCYFDTVTTEPLWCVLQSHHSYLRSAKLSVPAPFLYRFCTTIMYLFGKTNSTYMSSDSFVIGMHDLFLLM